MSQPKVFYNLAPLNGGYVVIRSIGNKTEVVTAEDTLPHALAKLNQLVKAGLGV